MEFEDKVETIDKWESGAKTVSVRDIMGKEYFIANVENRVPGTNVVRKCFLFKINYNKAGDAKI